VLETAPTRGEGFNTNTQTIDAQAWESDWDHLFNLSYTSVLSDRATNVLRAGRIGEQLGTGAQAFFDEKVRQIGFAGRDPFSIGQQNIHPSYITGKGGTGQNTRIRTYTIEGRFQLLRARALGRRAYVQGGRRLQPQPGAGPVNSKLRDIPVQDRCALRPRRARDVSISVDITVGPPVEDGFATSSKDRRYYLFFEDKWRIANTLTLNLVLRYDNQKQISGRKNDIAPRLGFAWDVTRSGSTVVRGGFGRFYAYMPVSVVLNQVQDGVLTRFPTITITDLNSPVLRPDSNSERGLLSLVLHPSFPTTPWV
jgi:outer membrane receptor protein involved in Fe transport